MSTKTITHNSKQISETLNKRQADLSKAVLESVENQRAEVMGLVQEQYGAVKEKAQQLFKKGAQAQEKLGQQVGEYNTKLEVAAKKLPKQVNQTVANYPWVALAVALVIGAAIGFWFKTVTEAK